MCFVTTGLLFVGLLKCRERFPYIFTLTYDFHRFSDSTSRWSVESTTSKHPTNTNNGAIALRNMFSGLYLQALCQTHDANGARLETPVCSVQVVLDPYDEFGNIRSSCAFTFENNCLRNCSGIALDIGNMTDAGKLATLIVHTRASNVFQSARGPLLALPLL